MRILLLTAVFRKSNVTEPVSENDDEQLWSQSDDVSLQGYS